MNAITKDKPAPALKSIWGVLRRDLRRNVFFLCQYRMVQFRVYISDLGLSDIVMAIPPAIRVV